METEQDIRRKALEPLFAVLQSQGRSATWLARQLGVSVSALGNYRHGIRRMPPGMIERACRIIGIPPALVPLSAPYEVLFQGTQRRRGQARAARGPPAA